MSSLYPLALVSLTSAVALMVGIRVLGISGGKLWSALAGMFECVGLAAVFFAVNLALGMLLIVAFRTLTPGFAPMYLANDASLLAFSFLQGMVFSWWLKAGPASTRFR